MPCQASFGANIGAKILILNCLTGNGEEGLKRSLSLQRFDTKSDASAAAWMTALMDGDHVPDYPTPFDTFITRSNSQLNRA